MAGERELEKQLKALANRRRLAIIALLKKKEEVSVGKIASEINLSFKSTSRHLAILSAVDIIEKEQRSLQVFYRLARTHPAAIRAILSLL